MILLFCLLQFPKLFSKRLLFSSRNYSQAHPDSGVCCGLSGAIQRIVVNKAVMDELPGSATSGKAVRRCALLSINFLCFCSPLSLVLYYYLYHELEACVYSCTMRLLLQLIWLFSSSGLRRISLSCDAFCLNWNCEECLFLVVFLTLEAIASFFH